MCPACQTAYTLKNALTDCSDLASSREIFYSASNLKELFKQALVDAIIYILKAVSVCEKKLNSDNSEKE